MLFLEEQLDVVTARRHVAVEARDERVDDELHIGAPRLSETRVCARGDYRIVVVADDAEVYRAGRGQEVGHDAEVALALA